MKIFVAVSKINSRSSHYSKENIRNSGLALRVYRNINYYYLNFFFACHLYLPDRQPMNTNCGHDGGLLVVELSLTPAVLYIGS